MLLQAVASACKAVRAYHLRCGLWHGFVAGQGLFVQVAEGALGIGVAVFGCFAVEPAGRLHVFFATEAFFI